MGQSPPSSTYNTEGRGLPFFQGKAEFGELYPCVRKWCAEPKKVANAEDVLISVRAPVGPTNLCPEKACIGRGLAAIRGCQGTEARYLLYVLRAFERQISDQGAGTTFAAISGADLKSFGIPICPLPEQRRIVAKIEELFTRLDAGVAALERAQALLERYRQSVLKEAFEGRLTAAWREAHRHELEPAAALLERIRRERETAEQTGQRRLPGGELPTLAIEELADLPDGWEWARLGDLSTAIQYGYTAKAVPEPVGPKMLRITDIQNQRVYWDSVPHCKIKKDEADRYFLNSGDLLFARTGATVGKSFLVTGQVPDAVFASYLIRVRLAGALSSSFIYQYLQSTLYWQQISELQQGIGQPNVNGRKLAGLVVPLPPKAEQDVIVRELSERLSTTYAVRSGIEQAQRRADQLRQSILRRAFEGKLVPQDPSDEPAEILLERIRAARQDPGRSL